MNAITVARDSVALARQARLDARSGRFTGPTANLAPGHVQANLAILPRALAADFPHFCQRNPKPCPLLAMSEPGDPSLPELGQDIDIRSDIPRYRVWKHGELVAEPTDVHDWWRDDLVSFLIGCSFVRGSHAGQRPARASHPAGAATCRCTGPTCRRSAPACSAVPWSVHAPLKAADAIRAIQVTSRFPSVHGAPVHLGDPSLIGIADIAKPDYGDAVEILPGEIPVFWACGVTPQSVVAAVKPEFCITHAPGHMLVTDLVNSQMAIL